MPLEVLETVLAYAVGVIGVLLSMLIGMGLYVFFSLKTEVAGLRKESGELVRLPPKLVHRDDCREMSSRIHERLNECDAHMQSLTERMARVETTLDLTECS